MYDTNPTQIAEKVRGESRFVCPDYDGVPQYGGPCWTCQGVEEQCPMTARNDGSACSNENERDT